MVTWKNTKLESLMRIATGGRNTEDRIDGARYPFFVRSQEVERIDDYAYDCEAVLTVGDGVGTGKVFHYIHGKFNAHQRVYVMSQFNGIDGKYFYYYFSRYFFDEVAKYTAKSSVDSVRRAMIAEMEIPLPPIPEQRRIAEALSDTDALLAALEKLIAKKRAIKQGAMQELLTGKRRLPGFERELEVKTIGECAAIIGGGTPSTIVSDYWDGDILWCTPTDITKSKSKYLSVTERSISDKGLQQSAAVLLPVGTILLCSRATIGEMCIAKIPIATNQGFKNLVCNATVDNSFLYYLLQTKVNDMLELAIGSTFLEISKKALSNIEIQLPDKTEQTAIAEIFSDMDAEIDALTEKLNKLRNIKQGMMSELLTGRIRLAEQNAEAAPVMVSAPKIIALPKPKPKAAAPQTGGHNQQFDDAVAFAVVAKCFALSPKQLYRVKTYKLIYLLRRKQSADLSEFRKKAAGPYKSEARYAGGEKIAIKRGYIVETKDTFGTSITLGKAIEEALDYAREWGWQIDAKWLIDNFKGCSTNELETLATVDMSMRELRATRKPVTVETVKGVIRSDKNWVGKLVKQHFSDANIARAIAWSGALFGQEI